MDAGRDIGAPLALAAAATAAGFLAFLPTNYQGVSELGLIAGVGMFVAFLMSITVLPALLAVLDPPGEKEPLGFASFAVADSFVERNRKWVVGVTLGIAIIGLPLLYFLRFDFNPDQSAQSNGGIDLHLSRPAPGSQHRCERDQCAGRFGEGRQRQRPPSWRSCPKSSASCRSTASCPTIRRPSSD